METYYILEGNVIPYDFEIALMGSAAYKNWQQGKNEYRVYKLLEQLPNEQVQAILNPANAREQLLQQPLTILDISSCIINSEKPIYKEIGVQKLQSLIQNHRDLYDSYRIIPVGSLAFVSKFTRIFYGLELKAPLNIPNTLNIKTIVHRKIYNNINFSNIRTKLVTPEDLPKEFRVDPSDPKSVKVFCKQASKFKTDITGVYTPQELFKLVQVRQVRERYFLSSVLDFKAEWHIFVYRGKLVGIKQYNGDPFQNLSKQFVDRLLTRYFQDKSLPSAATLDIGLTTQRKFALIEVHPFVSCGLYGLDEPALLCGMVTNGYQYIIDKPTKK